MTWVSKPLLPSVYLRVRNGNGINFSIIIMSRNQICWQHFKWPSWSRAEGSHVRHLKEEGGGEEEGYETSGLSNMVWVDLETIRIWKILYSVRGEVIWAALPYNQLSLWSKCSYDCLITLEWGFLRKVIRIWNAHSLCSLPCVHCLLTYRKHRHTYMQVYTKTHIYVCVCIYTIHF